MSTHRVITRTKPGLTKVDEDFTFTKEDISALSKAWGGPEFVREYREDAWRSYKSLPIPNTKDEAWRRTDLHGLNRSKFILPNENNLKRLPSTPKWLLKPLVKSSQGGQIVIRPEKTN
jgi:hypothetical protein